MKPELCAYVLTLPADIRRHLLNVDGPGWLLTLESSDARLFDGPPELIAHDHAYLPVSPKDIAKHAAKLAGAVGHTIETFADRTTASVRFRVSDVVPGGKLTISDYADGDETGHRAAIGLLRKVMER